MGLQVYLVWMVRPVNLGLQDPKENVAPLEGMVHRVYREILVKWSARIVRKESKETKVILDNKVWEEIEDLKGRKENQVRVAILEVMEPQEHQEK